MIYADSLFALNMAIDYFLLLCSARLCGARLRRARFALVEGGATLLAADWEETHPVTRLGQVQTLKNP